MMIPEEIREKLIELLRESQPLKDFESLIERAIEAEREGCAALCDHQARDVVGDWAGPRAYREAATEIAAAIRARGKAD